jgi:hypothetical protein
MKKSSTSNIFFSTKRVLYFSFLKFHFFLNLIENANIQEIKNFIQEIEIMKGVGKHENIVTLMGISTNINGI